jgi:D-glycero-alpha-D-manno-heptose-7-phosphate kinase
LGDVNLKSAIPRLFLHKMTIIRSKAPLRLGLAGGGTDVSPYSDQYGGAILNATINKYAHVSIEPLDNNQVEFHSKDRAESCVLSLNQELPDDDRLLLHIGVYKHIIQNFKQVPSGFRLTSWVDAPAGSGLGSSSTLVVALIGAFAEWLQLPLGEYEIAHLAYVIEREELQLAGGKQDQYAATFGGFNFMEFYDHDKVIVNPLRLKQRVLMEIQHNMILFYTGKSRESAAIIKKQTANIEDRLEEALEATHKLKEQALRMKEAVLTGKIDHIGDVLHHSWMHKKKMAQGISTSEIDQLYQKALDAGCSGGKISGAGGGGFMFFYCPGNSRYEVIEALQPFQGEFHPFEFTLNGLYTYSL